MATKSEVQEVLDRITESAQAFLAAKNGKRIPAAHELRKACNRLYAVERAGEHVAKPEPPPEPAKPTRSTRTKKQPDLTKAIAESLPADPDPSELIDQALASRAAATA